MQKQCKLRRKRDSWQPGKTSFDIACFDNYRREQAELSIDMHIDI